MHLKSEESDEIKEIAVPRRCREEAICAASYDAKLAFRNLFSSGLYRRLGNFTPSALIAKINVCGLSPPVWTCTTPQRYIFIFTTGYAIVQRQVKN
jgi:hypothetical protein